MTALHNESAVLGYKVSVCLCVRDNYQEAGEVLQSSCFLTTCLCCPCQVLYKHEGQNTLKVLDRSTSSVRLPLPKDNTYVVLEIRSWGEGGDGPAQEIIVSRDSGQEPF